MIKDPFHQEETPYELLKLDPVVSHNAVHDALIRFMKDRANLPKLGKAQEAIKKLKNHQTRMSIDILYYDVGEFDIDTAGDADIQSLLEPFLTVPILADEEFYVDLHKKDFSDEITEIKGRKVEVSELTKYNDIDSVTLSSTLLQLDA